VPRGQDAVRGEAGEAGEGSKKGWRELNRLFPLGAVLALFGCVEPHPRPQYVPAPDFNDFKVREDCLYQKICTEIHKRGTDPLSLEGAALYVGGVCQQPISLKMMRHTASTIGYRGMNDELTDERMAQIQFNQHALTVAQQLKDQCGTPKP